MNLFFLLSSLLLNIHFTTSFYPLAKGSDHNVVFSPLSLQQGIGMTLELAQGETKEEILSTLCLPSSDNERRLEAKKLLENLNQKEAVSLANGAWLSSDIVFSPALETYLLYFYRTSLHQADFRTNPEATRGEINEWVDLETDHQIPELLPEGSVDPMTKLVLINTLHLRAPWKHPFDPKMSFEAPFFGLEKSLRPIPYMRKCGFFGYLEESLYSVVEIPFKEDLSLFIVVPSEGTPLQEIEKRVSTRLLQHWLEDMDFKAVDLTLPKFKVATTLPAKKILQEMGMKKSFDPQIGDFGLGEGVVITDILHQSVFEVDEFGGTGSSATGVAIGVTSVPMYEQMVVNRPFLFFVAEKASQTILFTGRIQQPRI